MDEICQEKEQTYSKSCVLLSCHQNTNRKTTEVKKANLEIKTKTTFHLHKQMITCGVLSLYFLLCIYRVKLSHNKYTE